MSLNATPSNNLKKEYRRVALATILFIIAIYLLLHRFWDPAYALRWLGLSATFSAWQLFVLWHALRKNHREGEAELLPTLGWGTIVSFARGIFIAALFGFLLSPWAAGLLGWLPFTFYLFAALSDFIDGYLARINDQVTQLGAELDMNNDSWGVLIVTGLAFWYGQVPIWYLPVGLARYLFTAGLWWREKQGKENLDMPPSFRRRIFAGVQMGFIVAMLAPPLSPPATLLAASFFMLPFLGGFLYDWLLVTGKIDPQKGAKLFEDLLQSPPMRWVPFPLRLITAAILITLIQENWQLVFDKLPLPLALLWISLSLLAVLMLILGALGRLGAIFSLISTGLLFAPQADHIFLFVAGTTLLFTGTGAFSLWSPEEWLIYNRAGEQTNE